MKDKTVILKLRAEIPDVQCKKGCSDCCGPIFFSKWEWEQIEDKRRPDINNMLECPYVNHDNNDRCDIYENRPIICRLFGTTTSGGMKCFHGCRPKKPLTPAQVIRISAEWMEVVDI